MSDRFDVEAKQRMTSHVLSAARRGANYAPDTTLEMMKAGKNGPHSTYIARILAHWGAMWAQDMREGERAELDLNPDAEWKRCIAEAEAEIERYLASFNLKLRAA